MKKMLMIVGALILIAGIGSGIFIKLSQDQLNELVNTPITDVDLRMISDGTYTGAYSAFPVNVTVEVTVLNHQITLIAITQHDNGQGKPAEAIVKNVIESQSVSVDVISGATYSSKVILLAIRDALTP